MHIPLKQSKTNNVWNKINSGYKKKVKWQNNATKVQTFSN